MVHKLGSPEYIAEELTWHLSHKIFGFINRHFRYFLDPIYANIDYININCKFRNPTERETPIVDALRKEFTNFCTETITHKRFSESFDAKTTSEIIKNFPCNAITLVVSDNIFFMMTLNYPLGMACTEFFIGMMVSAMKRGVFETTDFYTISYHDRSFEALAGWESLWNLLGEKVPAVCAQERLMKFRRYSNIQPIIMHDQKKNPEDYFYTRTFSVTS
jgi:hypothetical protein